jgi:hypothetical protein
MMILLEQAIPCVLHLENRVGEKIVMMLLRDLVACHSSTSTAAVATLVKAIEKSINITVLGTPEQPSRLEALLAIMDERHDSRCCLHSR